MVWLLAICVYQQTIAICFRIDQRLDDLCKQDFKFKTFHLSLQEEFHGYLNTIAPFHFDFTIICDTLTCVDAAISVSNDMSNI
jgi:hypothetical protein